MKEKISNKLVQIINNKTLGSSELVNILNDFFKFASLNKNVIEKSLPAIKKNLGHFAAVNDYVNELKSLLSLKSDKRLIEFFQNYSEKEFAKYEKIFNRLYKYLPDAKRIITLSRSGTLLNILKLWHKQNKMLKLVVCESRPMFEGRLLAKDLVNSGIKVELITDAMMSLYVPLMDSAIIGADSVLQNCSVINKTGSKALALFCKEYKKPFYVVTTRSKKSNKKLYRHKKENPDEVWNKPTKNITVRNIYFEEIEKKLITKIFTD